MSFCASGIFLPKGFPFLVLITFLLSSYPGIFRRSPQGSGRHARRYRYFFSGLFFILPTAILLRLSFRALGEKQHLLRQHRVELTAQETYSRGLKEQLIQLELKHSEAMKVAETAAEARLNEALEDANNSTVVLRAELDEGAKARQAAEDETARLKAEQQEYDLLVMQTDALALSKFLLSFPVSLISLSLPVACTYLFLLFGRALPGFSGIRPEEGGGAPGGTGIQEPGCALGPLRSSGCTVSPHLPHACGGPEPRRYP